MKFQAVRVSRKHPTVHAASPAITEETKPMCQTFCGAHLGAYSPIDLSDPVTCSRCHKSMEASKRRRSRS